MSVVLEEPERARALVIVPRNAFSRPLTVPFVLDLFPKLRRVSRTSVNLQGNPLVFKSVKNQNSRKIPNFNLSNIEKKKTNGTMQKLLTRFHLNGCTIVFRPQTQLTLGVITDSIMDSGSPLGMKGLGCVKGESASSVRSSTSVNIGYPPLHKTIVVHSYR